MNSAILTTTPAAPSAPAVPSPTPIITPSPSATPEAADDPTQFAYYERLASRDLQAAMNPPGQGSPPVAPTAPAAIATPAPVQTPKPAAAPGTPPAPDPNATPQPDPNVPPAEPDEDPLPPATSESEQRIYGALQKERQARKDAKAELKQTREQFDALKQELTQLKEQLKVPAANEPAKAGTPSPAPVFGTLADCNTFEEVDARATQAITTKTKVERLQNTLSRLGAAKVVESLKAEGVTHLGNLPLAEASDEQVGEFLISVKEGAELTHQQTGARKQFLVHQAASWTSATKLIPELLQPQSPRAQAYVKLVNENPGVRSMGANWPLVAAEYLLGKEAAGRVAQPAPTAPAMQPTPTPQPAGRPAPSAPRTAPVAAPQPSEADQLAAKINAGTATERDIDRYAALSINA